MQGYEITLPVLAAVIWSTNPPIIYRYARNTSPSLFTFVRALMALAFLSLYALSIGGMSPSHLTPSILFYMALSGALGPGLGDIAYTRAIQLIGGPLAITVSYAYIFFAQLFASLLFNEELTLMTILGGVSSFTGIFIAVYGNNHNGSFSKKGLIYSISAAVLWGLAAAMIRMFREHADVYTTAIIRLVAVAVFALIMGIAKNDRLVVSKDLIIATFFTGVLSWGVGMILFIQSIYTIGVSTTSVATALAPVLTQFINKAITGESISYRIMIGALLVSLGIVISVL